jgi:hypothetical protein
MNLWFAAFVVWGFPPWGLIRAPAAGAIGRTDEACRCLKLKLAALASADQDHSGQAFASNTSEAEPEQPKPGATHKKGQLSQTQQLLALATNGAREDHDSQEERAEESAAPQFFHTPDHDAFVTFMVNGHLETWPCKSKAFRRWLAYQFFLRYGRAPRVQAVQEVLQTIEGRALFDGRQLPVFMRVAAHNGVIYLDLADEG